MVYWPELSSSSHEAGLLAGCDLLICPGTAVISSSDLALSTSSSSIGNDLLPEVVVILPGFGLVFPLHGAGLVNLLFPEAGLVTFFLGLGVLVIPSEET